MNGKAMTTRTRLERGRSALGPALELVHTGPRAHPRRAHRRTRRHPRHRRRRRRRAGSARADQGRLPPRRRRRLAGPPLAPARRRRRRAPSSSPPRCTPTASAPRSSGSAAASSPPRPAASPSPPTRRRCSARSSTPAPALLRESGRRCVGAGLAVPSAVAEPEGTALNPLHLAWPAGAPVRDIFTERRTRAPGIRRARAFTGNDVNLAALAEHRHGAGRGAQHLLCVATGHRGVGGALVLDGRLHTGSSGLALEVGHLTVNPEGRPCHCGSRGCLDVEADPLAFLTPPAATPAPRSRCSSSPGTCCVRSTTTRPYGPRPRSSSTGSASASPGWSTSSTPTASSSAACTASCSTPTPSGCAPWSPTAACGGAAAACRSWPARWTTTAWSAPPSWPGSRCSTTRWPRSADGGRGPDGTACAVRPERTGGLGPGRTADRPAVARPGPNAGARTHPSGGTMDSLGAALRG